MTTGHDSTACSIESKSEKVRNRNRNSTGTCGGVVLSSSSSALRRGRRDVGGSGTGGGMSTGARATCRGRCGSRPLRLTGRTPRCGPATCSRTRLQLRKKGGDPSVPGAVCDRCWSADLDETALRGGTTGWRWRHRRPERQCLRGRPPAPANLSRC